MFLIVLGIIVIIIATVVLTNNPALAKFKPVGRIVGLVLLYWGYCLLLLNKSTPAKSA